MDADRQYAVSVITPCHNVNIALLERAFASLRDQTCGFDRLEWIVVIHNCTERNAGEIEALCAGRENIKTYRLKSDRRQAAVPRNYGLTKATGKYIAFLDADDFFETDLFEVVLSHFAETNADLVAFRYEVIMANPDVPVDIRPLVFLDQTQKRIVYDADNRQESKFIHGEAMNLGSKVYLRSFLEENKINFDVRIPYAEEGKFHLMCYGRAKKLCFLPQYIGFYYCRYADSMTGMMKKSPDVVLNYAWGFSNIFDTGLALGLDINTYMWDLIGFLSAILIVSMSMTYRDRKQVYEVMKPYMKMLKPLPVTKVNSASKLKLMNTLVSLVIGRPRLIDCLMRVLKLFRVDIASKMAFRFEG